MPDRHRLRFEEQSIEDISLWEKGRFRSPDGEVVDIEPFEDEVAPYRDLEIPEISVLDLDWVSTGRFGSVTLPIVAQPPDRVL